MKRIRRGVEGCTQPSVWNYEIYHKGVGDEDKTSSGLQAPTEKGPRENREALENAAVTAAFVPQVRSALGRFLATSGFGASGPRILKLMRPQTSSPQIAFLTPDLVVEPDL
jgi:hypothetical protein